MRRNGTAVLATGAILGGAAIGIGATLALVGNPLDRRASAEEEACGPVQEATTGWSAWWSVTTGEHGHRYFTSCPGGGFRYGFMYLPSHTHGGLTVKQTFTLPVRVRTVEIRAEEAAGLAEREALAGIGSVGKSQWEGTLSFERGRKGRRVTQATAARMNEVAAAAAQAAAATEAARALPTRPDAKKDRNRN